MELPTCYIAVTNANGWGKGKNSRIARANAYRNSHSKDNPALRVTVWPCREDAYVDGHGTAHGVTGKGHEYKRGAGSLAWVSTGPAEGSIHA